MTQIWKDKTCEDCVFRVEDKCRRFPQPVVVAKVHWQSHGAGPDTRSIINFITACSEHVRPPATKVVLLIAFSKGGSDDNPS